MKQRMTSVRFDGAAPLADPRPIREKAELTCREAAPLLGMSEDTLRSRIRANVYPFGRVQGHRVIVLRPELNRWLREQGPETQGTGSGEGLTKPLDAAIATAERLLHELKEMREGRR